MGDFGKVRMHCIPKNGALGKKMTTDMRILGMLRAGSV